MESYRYYEGVLFNFGKNENGRDYSRYVAEVILKCIKEGRYIAASKILDKIYFDDMYGIIVDGEVVGESLRIKLQTFRKLPEGVVLSPVGSGSVTSEGRIQNYQPFGAEVVSKEVSSFSGVYLNEILGNQ